MSFSQLKRKAGIESGGNLAFHLGKLTNFVKTDSSGNFALTDEVKEALRVVEATERVTSSSQGTSLTTSTKWPGGRTVLTVLLIVMLILGTSLIVAGSFLGSQTLLTFAGTGESAPNFTLTPGYQKFWFDQSDMSGTYHIVYAVSNNGGPPAAELQISGYSRNNGSYDLSTQSYFQGDYVNTYIRFPSDEFVKFTFVNPSDTNVSVVAAIIHFDLVTHPYLDIGTTLLYLGRALVADDAGFCLWWFLTRLTRKNNYTT